MCFAEAAAVISALIQTEAERRRHEAGVQQSIENGLRVMYVCMYVYMFICKYGFRKYLTISTERVQSGAIR